MYNTGSPSDLWWELRRELASRMVPRMTARFAGQENECKGRRRAACSYFARAIAPVSGMTLPLATLYRWFTEGLDTADLKDAKTLLDELSN